MVSNIFLLYLYRFGALTLAFIIRTFTSKGGFEVLFKELEGIIYGIIGLSELRSTRKDRIHKTEKGSYFFATKNKKTKKHIILAGNN